MRDSLFIILRALKVKKMNQVCCIYCAEDTTQPFSYPSITPESRSKFPFSIFCMFVHVCNGMNGQLPLARLKIVVPVWDVDKVLRNEDIELLQDWVFKRKSPYFYKMIEVAIELNIHHILPMIVYFYYLILMKGQFLFSNSLSLPLSLFTHPKLTLCLNPNLWLLSTKI